MTVEQNVLIMQFPEPSKTFQAFSDMKQPGVNTAAIVERTQQGEIRVADSFSPDADEGATVGGLVGALVGILGGPLGVFLGWSTGVVTGALFDTYEAEDEEDGFAVLSRSIPLGGNALIVEMTETSHAVADDVVAKLNGTLVRISSTEVQAEVDAARKAARSAAAEARKVRRAEQRAEFKSKLRGLGPHSKSPQPTSA
jgi:uncharacterized membrane protein